MWVRVASLVKRLPFGSTAINPGLPRSTKCGKRPNVPSRRGISDTGAHAALHDRLASTSAPTLSASFKPSPVLVSAQPKNVAYHQQHAEII
jgi:hypothetical protein